MAIRIYKPTDSLQIYILDDAAAQPKLVTASHLRIYPTDPDRITLRDELLSNTPVENRLHSDILDEAGSAAGADMAAVLLYLAKIIG